MRSCMRADRRCLNLLSRRFLGTETIEGMFEEVEHEEDIYKMFPEAEKGSEV